MPVDVAQVRVPSDSTLPPLLAAADCVMISGRAELMTAIRKPLIVDLYDPFILSDLEFYGGRFNAAGGRPLLALRWLQHHLENGDLFLCASEVQRSFWLGMLAAGRAREPRQLRRRPRLRRAARGGAVRHREHAAGAHGARGEGRDPGHRRRRQGRAVGRRAVELVRSADLARSVGAPARAPPRGEGPLPRRPPSQSRHRRDGDGRPRARRAPASSGSSTAARSSSTGCRTPSARTICSTPTSRSACTSPASRRSSRSAPACSTTSGRACRWC